MPKGLVRYQQAGGVASSACDRRTLLQQIARNAAITVAMKTLVLRIIKQFPQPM